MLKKLLVTPMVVLALGGLAACGDDSDDAATDETTTTEAAAEGITVEGAWARNSPMVAGNGAAYLTMTSETDDALIGASVDADVAEKVELHETVPVEGAMGETGATGAMGETGETGDMGSPTEMKMVPVTEMELVAGEPTVLQPGGLHIMLLGLKAPLEEGSSVDITLDFENAEDMTVAFPIRTEAP